MALQNGNFADSITAKLVVIIILILLIQIPMLFVRGLINERQQMEYDAQKEIHQRWGAKQYIGSPVVNIYSPKQNIITRDGTSQSTSVLQHSIIGTKTDMNVEMDVSKRYLGIYETAVYNAKIHIQGLLEYQPDLAIANSDKAFLFIPLKHVSSLKSIENISINKQKVNYFPYEARLHSLAGIEIPIENFTTQKPLQFVIDLAISGSDELEFLPLSAQNNVMIQSNWNSPSFTGNVLPDERSISDNGFIAKWQVNNLIRSLSENSTGNNLNHYNNGKSFAVKTIIPANVYQVNERTVKYSFLIVVLVFAGFFLAELFFKLRLHPFQYLLIGISLSAFYTLLLSLSEYIRFNFAYLIASGAVILSIAGYCSVVLQQRIRGINTGILFAVLFSFIYVMVIAQDASLLMGSISIWFILALIMYMTRKIDWYSVYTSSPRND